MDLPADAEALLALPPTRFTGERNALAAALAARGDPAAARVRKLARPVGLAWVLNRLARERRRDVEALLETGAAVRAGQRRAVSGAGAAALREADGALRERARALRLEGERVLAAEGRPASPAALARLELLLRLAATGADRDALREGTLVREPAPWGGELSGFELVAGGRTARAQPARVEKKRDERAGRERIREGARRERERKRAIAKARSEAARTRRRAEREERAAAEAEGRARKARERAAEARGAADRAAGRLRELEGRR